MQTVPPALDLDPLRTFRVFAAQLNFTRAAAQLHVSQPAAHAHVGRVAEALGVALYRRGGRGLALTPEGRRVAACPARGPTAAAASTRLTRRRTPRRCAAACASCSTTSTPVLRRMGAGLTLRDALVQGPDAYVSAAWYGEPAPGPHLELRRRAPPGDGRAAALDDRGRPDDRALAAWMRALGVV